MTKSICILAALMLRASSAQSPSDLAHQQQPGWVSHPGGGTTVIHNLRPEGQTGPVLGHPFSATEVRHTTQTLADGTHVDHTDTSKFYRDAQGRMRTEGPNRVLIYDPVGGFTYTLDLASRTYEKHAISPNTGSTSIAVEGDSTWIRSTDRVGPHMPIEVAPNGLQRMHAEPTGTPITEDLAPQTVNGISSRGSRITIAIPAGSFGNDRDIKVVNERWYSDVFQVLVKTVNSDPRFGVTTYDLTNLIEGSPDMSLFQVPSDFKLHSGAHE